MEARARAGAAGRPSARSAIIRIYAALTVFAVVMLAIGPIWAETGTRLEKERSHTKSRPPSDKRYLCVEGGQFFGPPAPEKASTGDGLRFIHTDQHATPGWYSEPPGRDYHEENQMIGPIGTGLTLTDRRIDLPTTILRTFRGCGPHSAGGACSELEIAEERPRPAAILLESGKRLVSEVVLFSAKRKGATTRLHSAAAVLTTTSAVSSRQ
jgi:hypothetical protein